MPKLVRLYITNVAIGFALSLVFVAGLLWLNVADLQRLVFGSSMGWLAGVMMVMFNGIVFAGVQFAIAVMRMAEDDKGPKGGTRAPVVRMEPVRAEAQAVTRRR